MASKYEYYTSFDRWVRRKNWTLIRGIIAWSMFMCGIGLFVSVAIYSLWTAVGWTLSEKLATVGASLVVASLVFAAIRSEKWGDW